MKQQHPEVMGCGSGSLAGHCLAAALWMGIQTGVQLWPQL